LEGRGLVLGSPGRNPSVGRRGGREKSERESRKELFTIRKKREDYQGGGPLRGNWDRKGRGGKKKKMYGRLGRKSNFRKKHHKKIEIKKEGDSKRGKKNGTPWNIREGPDG